MKKHLLILFAICLGTLMAVSCNRENGEGGGSDGGGNTGSKTTIQYKMLDTYKFNSETVQISSCFHYNIKYVDANGQTVELNNISAPWSIPAFDVKSPFTARIEGTIIYNENELPDGPINFGAAPKIYVTGTSTVYDDDITGHFDTKAKFLEFIATHPDRLHFKIEHTF